MTLQMIWQKKFPIDVLLLMAVALLSGFSWSVGAALVAQIVAEVAK